MEMGRSASSGGKVVTFVDDAVANGRRRNGSLSSYLDVNNKDAVVEAGHAARPLPTTHGIGTRRRTFADGELDVFTAERYFKGAMDGHKEALFTEAAAPPVETRPAEAVVVCKPASSTATASSASSANSQTVLFRGGGHVRRGSRDKKCCVQVGVLMRTCSGKRSVRVDDGCASATTKEAHGGSGEAAAASRIDWYRELRMQKAALGVGLPLPGDGRNNSHGLPPSLSLGTAKVAAIGLTRDEKAGPELTCSSSVKRSFALVAPVVRAAVPATVRVGAAKCGEGDEDDDDDGAGSDSSSDLFEIKSLMIEDCRYEPSEASIQWSVVTADASERGDRARWAGGGRGHVAGRQNHRPVGLLAGCASHRAVEVSAPATKAVPPNAAAAMQRRGDGFHKARNGT